MTSIIDSYELSPLQAGMLYHSLSRGRQGADTEQTAIFLPTRIDEAAFIRAWQRVIERHSVLRTRFRWEGIPEPVQEVVDQARIPVESLDWRGLPEGEREAGFRALVERDRDQGFDLSEAPLVRLKLVRAAENEHWILSTNHHSVYDGRGRVLVLQEVFAFYEAFSRGTDLQLTPPRPYREYIEWLRTLDEGSARAYWQKSLAGFSAPNALPIGREHGAGASAEAHRGLYEARLSAALTSALKEFARSASVTLNTLVQGAWALLLHRYCGQEDIVFGATRACRRSALGGAEDVVGLFINTLPLRVRVDPDAELVPWLQHLRAQQVELRDYEHTPLVKVQGWSEVPRGAPLFESILVFENRTLDEQMRTLGGAWSERRFVRYHGRTNFPLTVAAYGDRELFLEILYSTCFDDSVVARMVGHLQVLLEGMATNPGAPLSELPLLTYAEQRQLLAEWNDTKSDYPADASIGELFEAQAARTPDAVALEFGGERLTYKELNARANRLAHYLRKQGVGPEVMVGLCVERSVEMVVGTLGILKAGGAYVPLDPDYPQQRLAFMLEDTQAPVLLTQASLRERLPQYGGRVVCLDSDWKKIASESARNPKVQASAASLAYVIYTSGSTGRPKGTLIEQRSVVRLVKNTNYVELGPKEVFLQFAPISFDASTLELWGPLLNGGRLVVAPPGRLALEELARLIKERGVTTLWLTAALFHQMVDSHLEALRGVRQLLAGGETLSVPHVRKFLEGIGSHRLINGYGPTENTTFTCCHVMTAESCIGHTVPIGRPIANTRVYVLDAQQQPVPVGVYGELYIGGAGLARGYLNQPELTAEKFVSDPFNPGERLYRTGDQVRYTPEGVIEFLGRLDTQVKVRGYRIELGEIEAALAEHPAIREAVVLAREDTPGDKRLVAYVVGKGEAPAATELKDHLNRTLPTYMVPSAFVALEALPLTPVGKVDRKALPAPEYSALQEAEYIAPRTPTEKVLADIWCDVLKRKGLSINEDFFELGGNSLLAMQVLSRVRYAFEVDLSWRSLFESPTVEQMNASILRSSETRQQVEKRAEIMLKVATLSDSEVDTLLTAELAGPGMESTWP